MLKSFMKLFCAVLAIAVSASNVLAFGEDILAASGQYTFFIRPTCGPNVTYYQRMVPCVANETVVVPRPVMDRYPVPVPDFRKQTVTRTEVPVGCAEGASDCVDCYPNPRSVTAYNDQVVPGAVPANIPTLLPVPRDVTKRIMLPQWFAVYDEPKGPVRKVH
jgi:hypothetical protein